MLIDRLCEQIKEKKAPIVVGLDPRIDRLPEEIATADLTDGEKLFAFNRGIIDAVADLVPAVKPQIAFYEACGLEGLKAYVETLRYARDKGLIVIGDVKRGDIGSTSAAYAEAHLQKGRDLEVDFMTINPYFGSDGLDPFYKVCDAEDKGVFVLVKTSNPSSSELQDLPVKGEALYQHVGDALQEAAAARAGTSGFSNLAAVVGATHPDELKNLRWSLTNVFFLVPGYGAQGGGAADVVGAFDREGLGAIVNSSRGIIYAYESSDKPFGEAAREATLAMREDLATALNAAGIRL
jgi:orotidine-5'-phosphate decarboxylase